MRRAVRRAVILFLFVFAAAPAQAEKALDHASAPMLRAAAEQAAVFAERHYAFTVDHQTIEGDKQFIAKLRFDPRHEDGAQWTVLEPAEDDLDKGAKKALKALRDMEHDGHPLLYDKLDEMLAQAEFARETDAEAVFVAQVEGEDFPEDALEVFITLDKAGGYVSRIDVKSKKAFKPMPIAKIEHLVQTQFFAAPHDNGPAFLTRTESLVEGSAMFKDFKSETMQVFSEIEMVEVEDGESAGE
ncbi:hypothetical protein [Hyphococcus sp.]|uniref:hypothetical protein n=1 Tax=Hyphococcus sp. TaxID=2038636 RepID=UPI003CCC0556